ncbi:MAG TPA: DUF1294 domain-containing protein [Candidatus Thermoplasmatota archaeon]|nr:DUF1294 domain-containing protein [Candidatus Thermoplasmatota archaeon]
MPSHPLAVLPNEWLLPTGVVLLTLNLLGFGVAVLDKRRARRRGPRVPEAAFHWLAFLGAWPGMLLAFLLVRHKTQKRSFQVPFVLASAAGTAMLALILSL